MYGGTGQLGTGTIGENRLVPTQVRGLTGVTGGALDVTAEYTGFDDFWDPLTLAVGPAGQALASLQPAERAHVREGCRELVPEGRFSLGARAWYATGTVA